MNLQTNTLQIAGQTEATLTGSGTQQPFSVQLQGNPLSVHVDGSTLPFAVVSTDAKTPWVLYGLLGAVAPAALAIPILLRRRPASHRRRIEELQERSREWVNQMRFEEAERALRKWEALQPDSWELHRQWAMVLSGRGDLQGAWNRLESMVGLAALQPRQRAEVLFDKAFVACLLFEASQEASWRSRGVAALREAVELVPGLQREASHHPGLRAFIDEIAGSAA